MYVHSRLRNLSGGMILSLLFQLIIIGTLQAQYTSPPVWHFGHNAGIRFEATGPVAINSAMQTHGARSAIQCNSAGEVLFSSNGLGIWDQNGNLMPGSQNPLWATFNHIKLNSIIVPHPGNEQQYYVINTFPSDGTAPYGPPGTSTLTYTVVDMSLNGGLGGVVPGTAYQILDNQASDQITVVPDNACGHWLISTNGFIHVFAFRTYHITTAGISTVPVSSPFSSMPSALPNFPFGVDNRYGNMIYAHSLHKLFMSYAGGDLYAYSFDNATGQVSNAQHLGQAYSPGFPASSSTPAICLSPHELSLYVSGYTGGSTWQLRQYPLVVSGDDVSLATYTLIYSTAPFSPLTMIEQPWSFYYWETDMQLGYDNKIYIVYTMGKSFLGRIDNPNGSGTMCGFVPQAVNLLNNTYSGSYLPAPAIPRVSSDIAQSSYTAIKECFEPTISLLAPDNSYARYNWQHGTQGPVANVSESGMYILRSDNGDCSALRIDSFDVTLTRFALNLGADTLICTGTGFDIDVSVPDGSYEWEDGSIFPRRHIDAAGAYRVKVQVGDCSLEDSKLVQVEECDCRLQMPTAFSPNGDGHNDRLLPVRTAGCDLTHYSMSVYNRFGQRVFSSSRPDQGWDGRYRGKPADVGTYMYYIEYSFRNSSGGTALQQLKGDVILLY